jgi:oligopeptide transport system ATP-binding protein
MVDAGRVDEPLLSVRNVVKHFPIRGGILGRQRGSVQAVDGVSFDVARGETLGIVGESGCGKSTLTRVLMLLDRPSSGQALFEGRDIFSLSARERFELRRRMQIVFQDPYDSLHPRMTAGQNIAEAWVIHRGVVPPGSERERARGLMERVGLNPRQIDNYPDQFSGGQRQRIGIARALALEPEVIYCDEAVSSLDVSIRAQVLNLFRAIQREFGLTYIFIAHDLSIVRHVADHVAVMYLGRIVEYGAEGDVYGRPSHPYTQALLSAVPVTNPRQRAGRRRILLAGDPPNPSNPPSGCRFRTRCWKAQDICAEQDPPLVDRGQGHPVACHFPEELTEIRPAR